MSKTGVPTKYLETFFKGEGAELYFAKPFEWKTVEGKEKLSLDITMDYNRDSLQKPLTVNFTLFSSSAAPKIDEVTFTYASGSQTVTELEQIYVDKDPRNKKFYRNRHTFKVTYDDFKALIAAEKPKFSVKTHGATYVFEKPEKWDKRRTYLQEFMVELIELNR